MSAYTELHEHFERISRFNHLQAIVGWDEASMMPAGGGESRALATAELNLLVHQMETDRRLVDLIDSIDGHSDLDDWEQANVSLMQRRIKRLSALPEDFVVAATRTRLQCVQAWRELRIENDWQGMLPLLQENLEFSRREAVLIGEQINVLPYDALIDGYEPGMTSERIRLVFDELKGFLPAFIDEVIDRQRRQKLPGLKSNFPAEKQRLHETGHAMYEQGLPKQYRGQPVGEALGMAMHESQSLIMEMQACRTREFTHFLTPVAQKIFAQQDNPAWTEDTLFGYNTRVNRGLIRVDADEVTYPMHIILRFELEQALITGEMEMSHLPDAWDAKMKDYLGISTAGNYQDGCLQDVHWMKGLFGYFPTYSLGAMIAAQLFESATSDQPEILFAISAGDFKPLLAWLRENVHSRGSSLDIDTLLRNATGSSLDPGYFRRHLNRRYG
jgi:carboxypeptidase Taq